MMTCGRISSVSLVLLSLACGTNRSEGDIAKQATRIVEVMNAGELQTFQDWGYGQRGQYHIWSRQDSTGDVYSCFYMSVADTEWLSVSNQDRFGQEFDLGLTADTSRYSRLEFKLVGDVVMETIAWDKSGRNDTLARATPICQIFTEANPFAKFRALTGLAERLGLQGTSYRPDIGDFIQFYLSSVDVLTYLPEDRYMDPRFKAVWDAEFDTGKMIAKDWNLRRLAEPRDNG